MERRSIATLATVALVAILPVVGCGGGNDEEGNASSAAVTRAEFIEGSAALCAEYIEPVQAEFDAYIEENGLTEKKPAKAQSDEIGGMQTYSVQMAIDVYRRTPPPTEGEEKAQVKAIRGALEKALPEATSTVPATSTVAYAKASKLARAHGFPICRLEIR